MTKKHLNVNIDSFSSWLMDRKKIMKKQRLSLKTDSPPPQNSGSASLLPTPPLKSAKIPPPPQAPLSIITKKLCSKFKNRQNKPKEKQQQQQKLRKINIIKNKNMRKM